jgi:hypothetical protein
MFDNIPNHMAMNDDFAPWNECNDLPEPEQYRYKFKDGSVIVLTGDVPEIEHPARHISRLWMAEEVLNVATRQELSDTEIINYINKQYDNR